MTESLGMTQESFAYDNLFAGHLPIQTRSITILSGEDVLARGSVLGKVTADGKYRLSLSAETDGSEVPDVILLNDIDATSADVVTVAAIAGEFNENKLTIGTGHTADSIREGLRDKGIFLKGSVEA